MRVRCGPNEKVCATYRDAYQAFLQAPFEGEQGVVNLFEIPKDWWPDCWFHDRARTQPKFRRPACPLRFALPGHPKSGNIWEGHTEGVLIRLRWKRVEAWCGIFVHPDGSILVLYVDDFMIGTAFEKAWAHWNEIGRHIDFSDPGAELVRYLGAICRFDEYCPEVPRQPRTLTTEMSGYLRNLVQMFEKEHGGVRLPKVKTPYP